MARAWSRRDRRDQPLDRIRRGGLFILLGFSPKLTAVLSIMPTPVMGSIVVFVASFMIMSGLQIILSSKQDTRKTFVIGIPLIFGLSLQALPELYAQVVPWLRPLFGSALTLATVLAVVLNLLLRVGTRSEATSPISGEGGGNRHHPSTFVIAEASHS